MTAIGAAGASIILYKRIQIGHTGSDCSLTTFARRDGVGPGTFFSARQFEVFDVELLSPSRTDAAHADARVPLNIVAR
eukprot:4828859-Pyramimonas_sp.AAC.1